MAILFKKGGEEISLASVVRKKKDILLVPEIDVTGVREPSSDELQEEEAWNKKRVECEAFKKEFIEACRKKNAHGTKLSQYEILIDAGYFSVSEQIGNKFAAILLDGDCAELKFSGVRRTLLEEFSEVPSEIVPSYARRHEKYFYETWSLYDGFHSGYYNLVKSDNGLLRMDEKYRPERLSYGRALFGR